MTGSKKFVNPDTGEKWRDSHPFLREDSKIYRKHPKDSAYLDFIKQFWELHTYGPCIRDIQHGLGISSVSVVIYRLRVLRQQEKLLFEDDITRSYRLPSMRVYYEDE